MTIFKRRIIAQIIDIILIAMISALIPDSIPFPATITDACIVFLFLTKDMLFRNASIGKKIMKIIVLDKTNERPSIGQLLIRNVTLLVLFWFELWQLKKGEVRLGDSLCDTYVKMTSQNVRE